MKPTSTRQAAGAKYLNGVAGVGLNCKTKLGAVVKIVDEHNKKLAEIEARKPE